MAERKVKAVVLVCDGCGSESLYEPHDEMYGWHIQSVVHVHASGAQGAKKIFACQADCVGLAVVNAVDNAR